MFLGENDKTKNFCQIRVPNNLPNSSFTLHIQCVLKIIFIGNVYLESVHSPFLSRVPPPGKISLNTAADTVLVYKGKD